MMFPLHINVPRQRSSGRRGKGFWVCQANSALSRQHAVAAALKLRLSHALLSIAIGGGRPASWCCSQGGWCPAPCRQRVQLVTTL